MSAGFELNRLSTTLLLVQACTLAVLAVVYRQAGWSSEWAVFAPRCAGTLVVGALCVWAVVARKRLVAETFFVLLLMQTLALVVSSGQYVVAALRRPLIDSWLAASDAMLGVSVPQLAAWTHNHPLIEAWLTTAYFTLVPQFLLAVIVLGFVLRNRPRLWEYAFHFHFCALTTLAAFAIVPATFPSLHYGFRCVLEPGRLIAQFQGLRAGTFTGIPFNELAGLVSFPSFHVAGAVMVTWGFRRYRWLLWPLIALNASLIAATVMSGAHYLIDVIATFVMFPLSLWAYRRCGFAALFETAARIQIPTEAPTPGPSRESAGPAQTNRTVIAALRGGSPQNTLNQARSYTDREVDVVTSRGNAVAVWMSVSATTSN
jgi:membrane-associated phospholipid phosphatase